MFLLKYGRELKYQMNIERFLREQTIEQRKSASGAFHKRGKGVKHGINSAFRTPYFYMSNKERKNLNGTVEVSNMYDTTIIPYSEFKTKNIEQQISLLSRWRENFSNKEIQAQMGIANSPFYALVKELGLTGNYTRLKGQANKAESKSEKIIRQARVVQEAITAHREPTQQELALTNTKPAEVISQPNLTIFNGLQLEYNREYTAEELSKVFTKLQLLVDGEENRFKLSLRLVEMA
jgi:hypothetical protein